MVSITFYGGENEHGIIYIPHLKKDKMEANELNKLMCPNGVASAFDLMLSEFQPAHRPAVLSMVRTYLSAMTEDGVSYRTYPSIQLQADI